MNSYCRWFFNGFLLVILAAGILPAGKAPAGRLRDIPYRIDPARRPAPYRDTRVLWHFEEGDASDATHFGNDGVTIGRVLRVPEGRHGGAALLPGGGAGFRLSGIRGLDLSRPAAVDFWFRPDGLPADAACLLEMGSVGDMPALRVDLMSDGRLRLKGDGVSGALSEDALEPGQWAHLALQSTTLYQGNRGFVAEAVLELLVNGFPVLRTPSKHQSMAGQTDTVYYQFPPDGALPDLSVGNSLRMDSGVRGAIDEFRITVNPAGFHELSTQEFLKPDSRTAPGRSPEHFQAPERLVFSIDFNSPDVMRSINPPENPVRMETGGTMDDAPPALPGEETGPEFADDPAVFLGKELLFELEESEAPEELRFRPLRLKPGVRGEALAVRGGSARIDLPGGIELREGGTIEFWLKPGDWDNLSSPPPRNATWSYRRAEPHILTLWGVPRNGDEGAARLVSLSLSRLQGARPISPAIFEDFCCEIAGLFARPRTPVTPHLWRHVLLVWGPELRFLQPHVEIDGAMLHYEQRSRCAFLAGEEVWERFRPSFITIGNEFETAFDELRIYDYPFAMDGPERANARATFTGTGKSPLGGAIVGSRYDMSLGKLALSPAPLHRHRDRAVSAEMALKVQDREITAYIDDLPESDGTVSFEVGLLPEGEYPVTGRFLDAKGETVSVFEHIFVREPVPWFGNNIGYPDTPPPPYEPVSLEEPVVRAAGREYHIGPDGNFGQIIVLGEPILADPIHFVASAGGRVHRLEGADDVAFGRVLPVETSWRALARGGGVEVQSHVSFEYDGMARYELEVRPSDGPVTVERLALEIPILEQHGWLMHALPVGGHPVHYHFAGTGTLRGREGLLWNSRDFSKLDSTVKMTAGNFIPSVWLGGAVRGLYWFADNDEGWVPGEERPAVAIGREGGVITMSLNFISEPFLLDGPRRIIYALMGTPPKPLPEDHQAWNRGDYKTHPGLAGRLTSNEAFAGWGMPVKSSPFDYWPAANNWEYAEAAAANQRSGGYVKYPAGVALMLYHRPRFAPPGPDTGYFAWEWQFPWTRSKMDCLIWYMDRWFGRDIMDGVYIDDGWPIPDYNWKTGSAYKLPDGRIQPGSANFAYREYLKRLYNVMHSHGKQPVITMHSTNTLPPYILSSTLNFDGEDGSGFRKDGSSSFINVWRLDRLMTLNISERAGLVNAFMLKQDYYLQGRDRHSWRHMEHRVLRSKHAIDLLFDFNREPLHWHAGYWKPGVELLPFWRNEDVVRITAHRLQWDEKTPEPDPLHERGIWDRLSYQDMIQTHPLRATLYLKENSCLLIVVNFDGREHIQATVELDLDRLGIPRKYRTAVEAEDIDDGAAPPEGVDLQRLEMPDTADPGWQQAYMTETADDVGQLADEMFEDIRRGPVRDGPPLELDNGRLMLSVPPHDFRAIELRWGAAIDVEEEAPAD